MQVFLVTEMDCKRLRESFALTNLRKNNVLSTNGPPTKEDFHRAFN
jgi:hypothetical protein